MLQVSSAASIDRFFTGPGSRGDRWRDLAELADIWTKERTPEARGAVDAAFADIAIIEQFHAYPGPALLATLAEHINADDATAAANLARRLTRTVITKSHRTNPGDWSVHDDEDAVTFDVLPPGMSRSEIQRPYFEVLIVTPSSSCALAGARGGVAAATTAARRLHL